MVGVSLRVHIILGSLAFIWSILALRAAYIQLIPNIRFYQLHERLFEKTIKIESRRGDIFDRNGKELAISIDAHSLFADPSLINNPKQVARKISKILNLPYKELIFKLSLNQKKFIWIKRRLDKSSREKIEKLKINGLGFVVESKRIYPNQHLLSQVLGFIGNDQQGLEGLELQLNPLLKGENQIIRVDKDAKGRSLVDHPNLLSQNSDGKDVWLTIDSEIQYILEYELYQVIKEQSAESALGLVMDPRSGEIIAMANVPTYDLNNPLQFKPIERRNRVISDSFEPGSTLKTFVIASGLENNLLEPNKKYFCENGIFKIGKRIIKEAEENHKFQWLTVSEILAHSSNIGSTKIAFDIGDEKYFKTLINFGFGTPTGISLPGEFKGILHPLPWKKHLLSNISFGHGISVTALQLTNAYSTIANGGILFRPRIIHKIYDPKNGTEQTIINKPLKQIMNSQNTEKLKLMLMMATDQRGTGWRSRINGFPTAGKTGTAQKVDPSNKGYLKNQYISSFIGFFPINQPQYVILVSVDNPKKDYYGSIVAAPIFSKLASFISKKSGITPVLLSDSNVEPKNTIEPHKSIPQNPLSIPILGETEEIRNLSLREIIRSHSNPKKESLRKISRK